MAPSPAVMQLTDGRGGELGVGAEWRAPIVLGMGVLGVRGVPGSGVEGVERVGGLEVQEEVREGGWQT